MRPGSPYRIQDVAHAIRVTQARASDLHGLSDIIEQAEVSSLLLHTLQTLLSAPGATERPPDDFSHWLAVVLREPAAAERVALACAENSVGSGTLREEIVHALRQGRNSASVSEHDAFRMHAADHVHLIESEVVDPDSMCEVLASASPAVWYWHLFEEPFRTGEEPSMARWLIQAGEGRLAERCVQAARTCPSLEALRRRVVGPWRRSCMARRIAGIESQADAERPVARVMLRQLARRLVHPEESA